MREIRTTQAVSRLAAERDPAAVLGGAIEERDARRDERVWLERPRRNP
jgi:hypothetical protein